MHIVGWVLRGLAVDVAVLVPVDIVAIREDVIHLVRRGGLEGDGADNDVIDVLEFNLVGVHLAGSVRPDGLVWGGPIKAVIVRGSFLQLYTL